MEPGAATNRESFPSFLRTIPSTGVEDRLLGAIGGTLAGALDEDTAVIIDGDVAIVAGTGAAHVVTAATDGTVSVRALTAGDRL